MTGNKLEIIKIWYSDENQHNEYRWTPYESSFSCFVEYQIKNTLFSGFDFATARVFSEDCSFMKNIRELWKNSKKFPFEKKYACTTSDRNIEKEKKSYAELVTRYSLLMPSPFSWTWNKIIK